MVCILLQALSRTGNEKQATFGNQWVRHTDNVLSHMYDLDTNKLLRFSYRISIPTVQNSKFQTEKCAIKSNIAEAQVVLRRREHVMCFCKCNMMHS